MGATPGAFSDIIANAVPADLHDAAFGAYNLVTDAAMLMASVIAGLIWTAVGLIATRTTGSLFAAWVVGVVQQHSNPLS